MTNVGLIIENKGNMSKVRFVKESACGGNCSSCGGCKAKPIDRWIENTLGLSEGDKVEVKSESNKILFSAFILYILPLIMFFTVYAFANVFLNDIISVVFGIVAFFLSFIIARSYGKRMNIKFEMVKRID